jgi:hypothetical protein
MKQCLACRGVVPESLDACPNCAIDRRPSLLKVVGLVALMTTGTGCPERNIPVPVYGAPPPPPAAEKPRPPQPAAPVADERADGGSP